MKRLIKLLTLGTLMLTGTLVMAQRTITGHVKWNENGQAAPLPGANVIADGNAVGTITDADGNFTLDVPESVSALTFSSIGLKSQTVNIAGQSVIDVTMENDVKTLDEVVVVGYGTQKAKDLTSAIATVNIEEIAKSAAGQPMQALQGKIPGVQVVSNGRPGGVPTIRVRGIGSHPGAGDAVIAPLYVVDGMFFESIDFLNMADIASMSVLKDASAAAIYGVRAANGVVLITTKSGSYNQKPEFVYDGYYGVQMAQNVQKMANAEQYSQMAKEATEDSPSKFPDYNFVLAAMQRHGRSRVNPNVPNVNTDWYKEILRAAPMQNHSLGVSGGSNKTTYSIGGNYFNQQGIANMKNNYERMNLRSKIDFKVSDLLTAGGNAVLSSATQYREPDGIWNLAYFAVPIFPARDPLNEGITSPKAYGSASDLGYRSGQNPLPLMDTKEYRVQSKKVLANFYVSLDLIPHKLNFKSAYNTSYTSQQDRDVSLKYFLSNNTQQQNDDLIKKWYVYNNQIWDNVLTYTNNWGEHNLTALVGSSYRDETYQNMQAQGQGFPSANQTAWYIAQSPVKPQAGVNDDGRHLRGLSYFGRLAYNYKDKYLAYATLRADGTSKYQEKWGYFPAFGAGWVLSEEDFMKGKTFVDYLKLRAGWGVLGNDKLASSAGSNTNQAVYGIVNGTLFSGTKTTNTFNYLTWESTKETNFGITARTFKNRLSWDADYYIRDTEKAVIKLAAPGSGDTFLRNVGVFRNSGFELGLNWSDQVNERFGYTLGCNMATLKNQARDLYGQPYIDGGSAEFLQRSIVGHPLDAFYGYKTAGVYQTEAEVSADPFAAAYNADPSITPEKKLKPGDFKYQDLNGDGKIDAADRTVLGSYFPNLTYGANLGINYRNIELSVSLMGQRGNKILNRKRGNVIWTNDANMDADLADNRWHGAGTSNKYPSSPGLRKSWNQKMSDYFVEDGAFFRVQNVQLAYRIKGKNTGNSKFPDSRIYVTADRPYTSFKYNGFTPEVANGVDFQTYPIPASYTVGVSVKF